jgi:hypothetical protein
VAVAVGAVGVAVGVTTGTALVVGTAFGDACVGVVGATVPVTGGTVPLLVAVPDATPSPAIGSSINPPSAVGTKCILLPDATFPLC